MRLWRSVSMHFYAYPNSEVEFWTFGPPQYFDLGTPLMQGDNLVQESDRQAIEESRQH